MTLQDKLETIRKACIKANPSIMELGFGCEIEWGGGIKYTSKYLFSEIYGGIKVLDGKKVMGVRPNQIRNILGCPIRLADVLVAIGECEKNWNDETWGVVTADISSDNHVAELASNEHGYCQWNLLKDDLSLQSPETIEFLYELLK